jgi:hypothetical protein
MSDTDLSLAEQLSALMDGQLPEAQARFLRRRLEHDAELRGQWSRMQLASSCLRAHAVQPMMLDCAAIRADEQASTGLRRPLLRWAVAASVAAFGLAMAPRFLSDASAPALAPVATTQPASLQLPSPAAADLVSLHVSMPVPAPRIEVAAPINGNNGAVLIASTPVSKAISPLPLDSQSPTDFPLVDTGQKRWPRSALVSAGNDPALEAYLVRHNQMLANDGLSGFVPYVDVVASSPGASDGTTATDAAQEPSGQ